MIPLDEISSFIDEKRKLDEEIKRLEKREKEIEKQMASAFTDYLNDVYSKWRPRIDERIVVVDFRQIPPFSFEAIIRDAVGNHYSFSQTLEPTNMLQAFFLNQNVHNYESAILVLPMHEFINLKNQLNLKEFLSLS